MAQDAFSLPLEDLRFMRESWLGLADQLRGRRFFLTGSTGLFGKWLLLVMRYLNNELGCNCRMTALSRNPEAFLQSEPGFRDIPGVEYLRGDVRDFNFSNAGVYDYILHAANPLSGQQGLDIPQEMSSVVVDGTRRMLEFARVTGARRMLYYSSGVIYGQSPDRPAKLREDFVGSPRWVAPVTPYGVGKVVAEQMCREISQAGDCAVVICRPFTVVGPFLPLSMNYAIGNFLADALAGRQIVINGDGQPLRAYLYMAELALWSMVMLLRGQPGEAYNAGTEEALSILEVARLVNRISGRTGEVKVLNASGSNHGSAASQYLPDMGKVQRELGLEVRFPLELALRRTWQWLLALPPSARQA